MKKGIQAWSLLTGKADAVQNYDEKKGIAYFDQGVVHSVAVRRRSIMLKLNATKKEP